MGKRLARAINSNNSEKIEHLLKKNHKLTCVNLYDAFMYDHKAKEIDPAIVDLLAAYEALPADVSALTIKFILFFRG